MPYLAPATIAAILGGCVLAAGTAQAAGDAAAGARAFRACAACHSVAAGRQMTGPSLAGIVGRKAASVDSFLRYSPALKSASIVWNEQSLDAWLTDPKTVTPGNYMTFAGIKDAQVRADLIAFLKTAGTGDTADRSAQGGGMMRGPELPDLKALDPEHQVKAITYCGDTYRVTTAAGETRPFWETNLRFKTDSSGQGPAKGRPAIMGAGMMGDRASVIFADPIEISGFIARKC
jgi:cytochrome c